MTSPVVFGNEPTFTGKSLDGALAEYMRVANQVDRSLTVVYLKSAGSWTRVALDAGTIHWVPYTEEPRCWKLPNEGFTYDLEDIGTHEGVLGSTVVAIKAHADGNTARVEIQLSSSRSLVLVNEDDETTLSVRLS